MKVFVCDDEPLMLEEISKEIEKNNNQIEQILFDDSLEMFEQFKKERPDLVILDIDMPKMNGITFVKEARKIEESITVVFVTAHEEMVFQSIRYQPFRFVRKKYLEEELKEALDSFRELKKIKTNKIVVEQKGEINSIECQNIVYVSINKHELCIVCKEDKYVIRRSMKEFEKSIEDLNFIRCHASFLVNPKYIKSIKDGNICLSTNESIPVSRMKLDSVKTKFLEYVGSSI